MSRAFWDFFPQDARLAQEVAEMLNVGGKNMGISSGFHGISYGSIFFGFHGICLVDFQCVTGWWFGTFFIFPYIGNNNPN